MRIEAEGQPCTQCGALYHAECAPAACVVAGCEPLPPRQPRPRRIRWQISRAELLVLISILASLAAIAVPNFKAARERAGTRACYANQKTLVGAMEMYSMITCNKRVELDGSFLQELKAGGYLQTIPEHPGLGPGSWSCYRATNANNGITCTVCGSTQ